MGLLRSYAVIFFAGWALWFWLDKGGPEPYPQPLGPPYGAAPAGGYSPYPAAPAGQLRPPADGGLIDELQYGVDLIKAGRYRQSFIYLWRHESWIVAGVFTALVLIASAAAPRFLPARRTFTRLYRRARPPR